MMDKLWIDSAKFEQRQQEARAEPIAPLRLKTSAELDAELADREIDYALAFLRSKGLHDQATAMIALRDAEIVGEDVVDGS